MTSTDRRSMLRLTAGALLLPALHAFPARAAGVTRFAPPSGPMRYTRRIERMLSGGASLVVSRSFGVQFARTSQGYRVEGEQVGVEVNAPASLDAIMKLEKERKELGLFPLLLDTKGLIVGLDGASEASAIDDAVQEATRQLAGKPFDPLERAQIDQFINAMHQSTGRLISVLPSDLFAPADTSRSERRNITLPNGPSGAVTVTYTADRDPVTGLMNHAQREVVTQLLGENRRTLESWQLLPHT